MNIFELLEKNRMYDISVVLSPTLPVFPGQPRFSRKRVMSKERGDRANVSEVSCNAHSGTHVDAPYHFVQNGLTIDRLPIRALIGRARVIAPNAERRIDAVHIAKEPLEKDDIVIFKTRNSMLWKKEEFDRNYVFLSRDVAEHLAAKQVKAVGFDYIIPDDIDDNSRPVHHILLTKGILLLEGLDLIDVPVGEYLLLCLPLRIAGGDAAPARAVLVAL